MAKVYVDLDDVLAQTGRAFLRVLADRFGRSVAFEAIRSYHLGESLGLGEEDLAAFLRLAHEPAALAAIEPMPGAAAVLAAWRRRGEEVLVVTGRPPATREATLAWLEANAVPFDELCFLDKYSTFYDGAHGTPDGVLTLSDLPGLGLAFAVEDFPGTAEHLADELDLPVALYDRPWNREAPTGTRPGGGRLDRCQSWSEVSAAFAVNGQLGRG